MGRNPNSLQVGDARRSRLGRLAWLPVPVLLAVLIIFWATDQQGTHESLYLLLTLNLVFSTLVCLFVAYLITRSFLVSASPGLLLLGCGVVIWGPAGVVATAAARGDANISITIYNSCVWLSGLCHLAGVSLSLRPRRSLSPPALWLLAACALAVGAVMLVTLSALAGWIPAFFIEERGGTPVRQIVLISAIAMFALTALRLGSASRRTMSAFAYWYALGLLLIAVGLFGVMLQTYHASILGWTGRATQALGGLYMLIAAVASVRESHVWGISLEKALRESEDRYRTLFETAPDAIVVHRDGRFLYANSAALALTGARSFERLARHTVLDFFRPQDRELAVERTRTAMTGDRLPPREATLLRLDGQEIAVEFHTAPVDSQGARAIQTIIRDITERKRAEEALLAKEAELQLIADATPVLLTRLSRDLRYVFVNRACAGMFGRPPEEIVGKPIVEILGKEAFETIRPYIERVLQGQRVEYETEIPYQRIGTRFMRVTYVPERNGQGEVVGWLASILDITARKQAEEQLRHSQEVYRAIVEDQTEFVTRFLPSGELIFMNEASLTYFGKKKDDVYGVSFLPMIPKEERARLKHEIGRLSRENPIVSLEHSVIDGKGRVRVHHWINRAILDGDGRVVEIQGVGRDITERKRAEEAMKAALLDARQRCAEISALMTCTRAVLECRDLVSAIQMVFNACRGLLGAAAGYVAVLTPDGQNSQVLFLEPGGLSCTVDPSLPMPVRGFRAEVYRAGRVMYHNDFANSSWAELLPAGHVRLESVLFAPMVVDGQTIGLLGLGNKPGGFTDHDATLAATFGELVAIALRNSRTLESLRELNATLENRVAERTAELEKRAKQLQKLTLELSQAEDRERKRIAAILHEDLQQYIAGAKFHLSLLSSRLRHDPPQQAIAAKVDGMLKEAIEKSRGLSYELSPAVLHMNDLAEILGWLARHMQAKHGLTVHVQINGESMPQSEAMTMFLFRATQEMLFNVIKHAGIHEARIRVCRRGRYLCLSVLDRGCGFDPQELRETSGLGLLSIRQRVELLGGRMKIKSAKGKGSRFHIVVPNGELPKDDVPLDKLLAATGGRR